MRKETNALWTLVEPYARAAGLELVELEYVRESGAWTLRIFIDRPWSPEQDGGPRLPGQGGGNRDAGPHELFRSPPIGHDDCERISRDVSAALDVADIIPTAYRLEVSSPGLERPLRREQDFQRFAGQKVKIRTTDPVDGRRNFSGTLAGASGGVVEVECDGRSCRVPIDLVAKANLVPDWAAEFRRASSGEAEAEHPTGGRTLNSHRRAS
jgi:ribosome maturation factor RimP